MDRVIAWLPKGGRLDEQTWEKRHRGMVVLLWAHVVAIAAYALLSGQPVIHGLSEVAVIALAAYIAGSNSLSRTVRGSAAVLGLFGCSALLVHMSGGLTEMHFHFFVILGVITLYQDWAPLLLGIGFIVVHHVGMAILAPTDLFDHGKVGTLQALGWVGVHAGFVLAGGVAGVVAWRASELQADEMHRTINETRDSARALAQAARELTGESEQLTGLAERIGGGATTALAEVKAAAEVTNEVTASVNGVADGASLVRDSTKDIASNAADASSVAAEAVVVAKATGESLAQLTSSTARISEVLGLISSIAEQTNLLALNATIEAARAGEAGKGFAVVANEVKELAKETGDATEEVGSMLAAIAADGDRVGATISQLAEIIDRIDATQRIIADAVERQASTTSDMVQRLDDAVTGTAAIDIRMDAVAGATETTNTDAAAVDRAARSLAQVVSRLDELAVQLDRG
jgi:methyl-accepting chemotaxis protein